MEGVEDEILANERLKKVLRELIEQPSSHAGFELKHGKLLYKGCIVLAKSSSRIPLILKEFHDSAAGGHSGFFRTYKRTSTLFYWEGMKKDI